MIPKIQYEILAHQVELMYPPHYQLKPGETEESHCEDIATFIKASGWTEEEYINRWMNPIEEN